MATAGAMGATDVDGDAASLDANLIAQRAASSEPLPPFKQSASLQLQLTAARILLGRRCQVLDWSSKHAAAVL